MRRAPLVLALCGVLFCGVALASNGLVAGVGDHGIHEVFIAAASDAPTFDGDVLQTSAAGHPSTLFWVVSRLRGLVNPGVLALAATLACWLVTGVGVGMLARALTPASPIRWLFAAAATAPAQLVLGGAPTVDPLLLPRLASLPLLLAAVTVAVRRRWVAAFAIAGGALLVHAPSASAVLAGLVFAWFPYRRLVPAAPAWALLGALPALVLARDAVTGAMVPDSLWPALSARLAHHLLPASFPASAWLVAAAWFLVAWMATQRSQLLRRLLMGLGLWAVVAGTAGPAMRLRLLLNLEPWQATRIVVVLAPCLAICALPHGWSRGRANVASAVIVAACVTLSPGPWRLGEVDRDVRVLGAWARAETPEGALFMLPPNLPAGFRVFSQRPAFGTWKDGGELQFDASMGALWAARMDQLCGCDLFLALPPETEMFSRSRSLSGRAGDGYAARTDGDLITLARSAGVTHVVRRGQGGGLAVGPFRVLTVR